MTMRPVAGWSFGTPWKMREKNGPMMRATKSMAPAFSPTARMPIQSVMTPASGRAMSITVVMYKTLGISNADIALYTSWLYLPWVIKPLWSPVVELFGTKRLWILAMQLAIGTSLALVALTLPMSSFFQMSLAMLWLVAFSSATHDIAADGFYMLALESHLQAGFVGLRSAFWRIAQIVGQGAVVYAAGELGTFTGDVVLAWSIVFTVVGVLFA